MSEAVKRFYVRAPNIGGGLAEMSQAYRDETGFRGLVRGEDYDALEAECERLREALRECLETMELFRITGQVYANGKSALAANKTGEEE